jgi:NADH-quinone oxidoreductase subunit J
MEFILFIIFGLLALGAAIAVIVFRNPVYSALALIITFFSQAGLFILLGAHFVAAVQVIVYAGAIMVLFLFVIMLLNLGSIDVARPAVGAAKIFAIILGVIFAAEGIYIATTVYNTPALTRVQQEKEARGPTITPAQLQKIETIKETSQLDDEQINARYVPRIAQAKTLVNDLTAREAQQLIETLQKEEGGKTYQIGSVLFSKFLLPFEITSLILLAALIGVIVLVKRHPA